MAWPKGKPRNKQEPEEPQPSPGMKFVPNLINPDAPFEVPINPQPKAEGSTIASCDTWRYHPDVEPRLFRDGEEIPEGWTKEGAVRKLWRCTDLGKWEKIT